MSTLVDLRCPVGPGRLLARLQQQGGKPQIVDGNLIEFQCRDCRRRIEEEEGHRPELVLHRFDLAGDLVETVIVR